jgi:hypothetical protein
VTWHLTRKNPIGHRAQVGAHHVWPLNQGVVHLAGSGHKGSGAPGAQRTGAIPGMGRDEPDRTSHVGMLAYNLPCIAMRATSLAGAVPDRG